MALNKVIVDQEFWDLFPDATINVMFINNFENDKTSLTEDDRDQMLQRAVQESAKYTGAEPFSSNPVVAQWREAFRKFPKRKGARASIEALLKRASKGHHFAPINPLVDVYNSISMTYGVPVGIEDADHVAGDMHLGKAKGGESFVSVGGNGKNESDPAREGEIIYYDDEGAVCRSLNWRDGVRTQVNDDTKNAVIIMEAVNEEQAARAKEAMSKLSELIGKYFNVATTADYTLTKDNPSVQRWEHPKMIDVLREVGMIERALDYLSNVEFKEIGLSNLQFLYVVRVYEHPGIIAEQLANLIKVDRTTLARAVQRLEKQDYIRREKDPLNKKIKHLYVTEKGKQIYPFIMRENTHSNDTALKGFSDQEAQQLHDYLVRVRQNIDKEWRFVNHGGKRKY